MPTKIEITPKIIFLLALLIVGGWLVVQIRDILVILFGAFILMSALRPAVDYLEKFRVPRFLAIFLVYILIIGIFTIVGTILIPPLVHESARFINHLPELVGQLGPYVNVDLNTVIQEVAPFGQNVLRVTFGVFSNIFTLFTLAVFTFYFLLERQNLRSFLEAFVGQELSQSIITVIRRAEERLGVWVRGQLLLILIVGTASYIGLSLLGVSYALPLALIAGALEVVPIIGPIISGVPAVLVAFAISPGLALWVVALYIVVQQLENNLFVPQVMQKTVGIPPLASLLALLIGGRLGGVVGILLSVPILLVLQVIVQALLAGSKRNV